MSFNNKILVITPTYNEIENIENFLNTALSFNLSVLVIDDNSPDQTADVVKKFKENFKNIYLISRKEKLGLGSAYRDGFDWFIKSEFTHCIEMDTDFSHRFSDLIKILDNINKFDVVIGSRYVLGGGSEGWDLKRKILSKYANKISKLMLKSNINDMTSGFRSFSRYAIENINYHSTISNGYGFQIEMAHNVKLNNLSVLEVPIIFEERRLGKSKMNIGISFEAFLLIIKLRRKLSK